MSDFVAMYEKDFEEIDSFTCVSVKLNLPLDFDLSNSMPIQMFSAFQYLLDSGVRICAMSAGYHRGGRAGILHIHLHVIAHTYNPPANPSQHRSRWCSKDPERNLEGCSFKYSRMDSSKPRFSFLSYPLKESLAVYDKIFYNYKDVRMTDEHLLFLTEAGSAIYQAALAQDLRNERCQERKKNALIELYELVKDKNFSDINELARWLDRNYIQPLAIEDYPDPKNYKTNVQKIAVRLGILKYSDMI